MTLRPIARAVALLAFAQLPPSMAQTGMWSGSSGYINTPSALMRPDGTWVTGLGHASPYTTVFVGLQALPWLEVTGRYQQTSGVAGFNPGYGAAYGSYKDKAVGFKAQLWGQDALGLNGLPAVAVGVDDTGIGTEVFASQFVAASRHWQWGELRLEGTLGYGRQRIDGLFGGMRLQHDRWPAWAVAIDHDRIDFRRDVGARQIGLDQRRIGRWNAAVEYQSPRGWGVQLGQRDGQPAVQVSLSIPLGQRSFTPKTLEPAPYVYFGERLARPRWDSDLVNQAQMASALREEGLRDVAIHMDGSTLRAQLRSNRYLDSSRAVGRALRVLLAHGPASMRRIEVTTLTEGMPSLHYSVDDLPALERFFAGGAGLDELGTGVTVRQAYNDDAQPGSAWLDDARIQTLLPTRRALSDGRDTGVPFDRRLGGETPNGHSWSLGPQVQVFFNDPSGAFKASLNAYATGRLRLGASTNLDASASLRLLENITDVTQPSNSLLPRVRSDVAEYFRGSRFKLDRAVVNHFWRPADQWYARASAGLYETMFAGTGAQVMYVPERAHWSADLAVDALAQRDFNQPLRLRDYRTWTALASVHHEWPLQITTTLRAGRFLARDVGVRAEVKREFASGVQIGLWYSHTNGRDITSPGSPSSPYRDKGVFISVPFDALAGRQTSRVVGVGIAPWTRDVGQMVESPADLRQLLERGTLRTLQSDNPLGTLGGVDAVEGEDRP